MPADQIRLGPCLGGWSAGALRRPVTGSEPLGPLEPAIAVPSLPAVPCASTHGRPRSGHARRHWRNNFVEAADAHRLQVLCKADGLVEALREFFPDPLLEQTSEAPHKGLAGPLLHLGRLIARLVKTRSEFAKSPRSSFGPRTRVSRAVLLA
jgi:hypothetical protein